MLRRLGALTILLAAAVPRLQAEPTAATPTLPRFSPVTDLLRSHLPDLPDGYGLVVEELAPDSLLHRAGLRRFDILLEYGGTRLRDGNQFLNLLLQANAEQPLLLFRRGQKTTLSLSPPAGLGPLLKGLVKAGGPPAVTVDAQPLQDGKLKVTFVYYSDHGGKLESVTCSGTLTDIEREVRTLGQQQRMSAGIQDLVDVALKRIRNLTPAENR